jgi:hypothetical protein
MKVKDLIHEWEREGSERQTAQKYSIHLPNYDAARIHALEEMYPGRSVTQIITDLLSAALDELEEAFPYIQGEKVTAEDEYGDPVYGDAGLTPRFIALTNKHMAELKGKGGG